jgi:hypothetical protein
MAKKTFLLRISPELWDELQRMAAEEFRSVNGQIEYLLREAVLRRRGKQIPVNEERDQSS